MRVRTVAAGLVALACCAAVPASRAEAATNAELVDQLRQAETAFAKSMADRDHAAFTRHLSPETVFFGGRGVLRGNAAVAAAWKRFFDGAQAPFSWSPAEVEVLDSGTLGMTSGPVLDPAGARIGTFNSLWRRDKDGFWKIVFDKGCPPCDCPAAAGPASSPGPGTGVGALGWLEGTWTGEKDGVAMEEIWTGVRGDAVLGMHRDVKGGQLMSWEFFRIAPADGGIAYFSSPRSAAPTPFTLVESAPKRAVFENKAHDFPQRILYWLDDAGALHARIEGTEGEKIASEEWTWTRAR
jgi:ketosteroid isomerase-like protein